MFQHPSRRGVMLILSSPSGAGKSTIARHILQDDPSIKLSVSVTTRAKRPSEIDGVHYHFVSETKFHGLRDRKALLEWAEVHGNYYGTPVDPVEEALEKGQDVLFDIDWQGTLQLYKTARRDIVSIFILPPSLAELKSRLIRRAEDDLEVISRRLENARTEMAHWAEYDYVLVNDDLEPTMKTVASILKAERARRERQIGMRVFLEKMLSERT